jgi:ABC-type sugar transport system substrate-binding protein
MEDFMKKVAFVALLLVAALALMGCPSVNYPIGATGNPIGSKTGTSSGQIILGLFGDVDAGVLTAAKNSGITKISTIDLKTQNYFGGIVIIYTTTVTGE